MTLSTRLYGRNFSHIDYDVCIQWLPQNSDRLYSNSSGQMVLQGSDGFTGTFAWADPKNNLVMVFLSNRVYPNADENKLAKSGIRGKIHKAFYDALKN
jgi:CubicO group peptidase (beta-lactamase class C family)